MKKSSIIFHVLVAVILLSFIPVSMVRAAGEPTLTKVSTALIRVPLVRQATGYTCGVASLMSVLSYYFSTDPVLRWVREDRLAAELGTTGDGTNHRDIARVATAKGLKAEVRRNMTIAELKQVLDGGAPVIVAIQAWNDNASGYKDDEDSGHYVVAIGYDARYFYFMDPSVLGTYACIPAAEFPDRWHDVENDGVTQVIGLGIVFSGNKAPDYDPERILPLE